MLPVGVEGKRQPPLGKRLAALRELGLALARRDYRVRCLLHQGTLLDVRSRGASPLYGLAMWMGFDSVVAPVAGLTERDWPKGRERAVFIVDHLLFGLVLSELRSRPRE